MKVFTIRGVLWKVSRLRCRTGTEARKTSTSPPPELDRHLCQQLIPGEGHSTQPRFVAEPRTIRKFQHGPVVTGWQMPDGERPAVPGGVMSGNVLVPRSFIAAVFPGTVWHVSLVTEAREPYSSVAERASVHADQRTAVPWIGDEDGDGGVMPENKPGHADLHADPVTDATAWGNEQGECGGKGDHHADQERKCEPSHGDIVCGTTLDKTCSSQARLKVPDRVGVPLNVYPAWRVHRVLHA